jgi:hypothetical protein
MPLASLFIITMEKDNGLIHHIIIINVTMDIGYQCSIIFSKLCIDIAFKPLSPATSGETLMKNN